MNPAILDGLVQVTKDHDRQLVNDRMAQFLSRVYPIDCVQIFKVIGRKFQGQVQLLATSDACQEGTKIYGPSFGGFILMADPLLAKCLETASDQLDSSEHGWDTLTYVRFDPYSEGAIRLRSYHDLSQHRSSILLIIRIYENFVSILSDSEHDKLTGLLNRRTFDARLDQLLKFQRDLLQSIHHSGKVERAHVAEASAWLAIIDIDHFKCINDNYGHLYGDEVLLLLSQQLEHCFRNSDLLFRFGGEEFVVILEPVTAEQALIAFERLRTTIADFQFPQIEKITISIGLSRIHQADYPPAILERADKALYYAKEHGRNCIHQYEVLVEKGVLVPAEKEGHIELF